MTFSSAALALAALLIFSTFAMQAMASSAQDADPEARPDIVVILADDMGFSDIASYGGEIDTPNLDRLAQGGVRFTQFYNYARCCPTRAGLLTGLYPHQADMGWMAAADMGRPGYRGQLSDAVPTIPEVLKTAGYGTYMVGKWHLTVGDSPRGGPNGSWPAQRGFDRFYGTISGGGSFYAPSSLTRDLTLIDDSFPDGFYYTDAISENGAAFIREHDQQQGDNPLFMYVAYTAPHWPLHAPRLVEKYHERYKVGYDKLRADRYRRQVESGIISAEHELHPRDELVPAWDSLDEARKQDRIQRMSIYAAQIEIMDEGIGRIVKALEETGRLDNTLILFLSDNGGCEEHGLWGFDRNDAPIGGPESFSSYGRSLANVSNTPFKEYKHWVHEGGIATPLIAHWPTRITDEGSLRRDPGLITDIMATCVDIAGARFPETRNGQPVPPMEGVSLLPAFLGQPLQRDEPLFWEHEGNRAVRDGKWKLVAKGIDGDWELYDMDADRTELRNVANEHPEIVQRMANQWQQWAEARNVLPMDDREYGQRIRDSRKGEEATLGSKASEFELKAGDTLPRGQAPNLFGKSAHLTVVLDEPADEGVLISQGGSAWGWALYVRDGKLRFAVRHDSQLHEITADRTLPAARSTIEARYAADGAVTLSIDGERVGTGQAKPMAAMPVDGLTVGSDPRGAVGTYEAPFAFPGKIASVKLALEK